MRRRIVRGVLSLGMDMGRPQREKSMTGKTQKEIVNERLDELVRTVGRKPITGRRYPNTRGAAIAARRGRERARAFRELEQFTDDQIIRYAKGVIAEAEVSDATELEVKCDGLLKILERRGLVDKTFGKTLKENVVALAKRDVGKDIAAFFKPPELAIAIDILKFEETLTRTADKERYGIANHYLHFDQRRTYRGIGRTAPSEDLAKLIAADGVTLKTYCSGKYRPIVKTRMREWNRCGNAKKLMQIFATEIYLEEDRREALKMTVHHLGNESTGGVAQHTADTLSEYGVSQIQ